MAKERIVQIRVDENQYRLMEKLKKACDRPSTSDLIRFALNELAKQCLPPTKTGK